MRAFAASLLPQLKNSCMALLGRSETTPVMLEGRIEDHQNK